MILELLQMTVAVGLFTVGLLLFAMIHLAQGGRTLRLAPPIWVRWAVGLLVLAIVVVACLPVASHWALFMVGARHVVATVATAY